MRNKKQIKTQIANLKAIKRTMLILSAEVDIYHSLEQKFIEMVKSTQLDVIINVNRKEEEEGTYERILETEIQGYMEAYIVFVDLVNIIGDD